MAEFRFERDSMGEMRVPADAYYGAQTARAVENFPISARRMPRRMIAALGLVKLAAAEANRSLGLLDAQRAGWIVQAAGEVVAGVHDGQFVVDVFQTGSGTSSNMNANEVIAGRANELAGRPRGGKAPVHPNDHVNLGQSSNDVFPTAMHLAVAMAVRDELVPALSRLEQRLGAGVTRFDEVVKVGRTHLQDATPIRVGQVFGGYTQQARYAVERSLRAVVALCELPLGGTAVGTGINAHPEFAGRAIAELAGRTGLSVREAVNHVEAQAARDAVLEASGLLRTAAASLMRIANDIRFLASGPRCGIGELLLPAVQPGSSIMPGKVNPVMCEMLMMASARMFAADTAVQTCALMGSNFELNVMMPLMAWELLDAVSILSRATAVFTERCVAGIDVDRVRCASLVEQSLAMCTALAPHIGYDAAAELARAAYESGRTVREVARERRVLPEHQLELLLDPLRMTSPQADMIGPGGG
ncbi:MAG: class II fumarate hydratase [Tepidisphaerales bacterium]